MNPINSRTLRGVRPACGGFFKLAWTAIAVVPLLTIGCSSAPSDGSASGNGHGADPQERAADGSPKAAADRRPGCPERPSCTDVATDGNLCLAPCDGACQRTHSHYSFWVSSFEVQHSGGLGRHQGISVLGVELSYDDRVTLAARPDLAASFAWPAPALGNLPPDIVQTMTDGARFTVFPMCSAPKVVLDIPFFNHGRTLSRDPARAENRVELRMVHADRDASSTPDNPIIAGSKSWSAQTRTCLSGIKDGHCDSVCGNCSYVLPSVSLDPLRHGDWSQPSSLVSGTGSCSDEASYYGGPEMQSRDSYLGSPFPNGFTHCAKEGCQGSFEAPTITGEWWDDHAVVSGLYGHNSNSDAEAEYRAFSACVSPGEFPPADVCAACGTGVGHQDPCGAKTNLAAAWWDRTSSMTKDFAPTIRGDEGDRSPAAPHCAWADFTVSGM
jgi:hypothetical protein